MSAWSPESRSADSILRNLQLAKQSEELAAAEVKVSFLFCYPAIKVSYMP